jgi:hypothetical protein
MKNNLKNAIKKVADDLMKLSDEDFEAEIKKHANGDIANILKETKYLDRYKCQKKS